MVFHRVCWGYNYLITRGAPSCILFPPVLYIIYPGEPNAANRIRHLPGHLSFAVGGNKQTTKQTTNNKQQTKQMSSEPLVGEVGGQMCSEPLRLAGPPAGG